MLCFTYLPTCLVLVSSHQTEQRHHRYCTCENRRRSFLVTGGSSHRGGTRLAKFVGQDRLKPFCSTELLHGTSNPILFRSGGTTAFGFEATMLADICNGCIEIVVTRRFQTDPLPAVSDTKPLSRQSFQTTVSPSYARFGTSCF